MIPPVGEELSWFRWPVIPPLAALRPPGCEAHILPAECSISASFPVGAPPPIRTTGGRSQQRETPGQDDDVGHGVVLIPLHLARAHAHELLLRQVPELAPIAVDRLKASKLGTLC